MKKEEEGMVYINRWNKYWDLENAVYRPVLLKILPMIFGVLCRIFDSAADGLVVLIRKTILKDSKAAPRTGGRDLLPTWWGWKWIISCGL